MWRSGPRSSFGFGLGCMIYISGLIQEAVLLNVERVWMLLRRAFCSC